MGICRSGIERDGDGYPTTTILPTVEVTKFKPTPVIASFSSGGPRGLTETILKAA
ncbi:hypothetical protein C5167_011409 [Papaver somniferum]|uniref:Uncharacterized protein n=1 Tax=Papaver somniferum TaxID=3469 RepID=A0A4Y7K5V2_PAPSO|nr:hypothetical protein C5167_011409 [Papaver somniferum]